jgi:O-antigen/teichoic acid export membrane protein
MWFKRLGKDAARLSWGAAASQLIAVAALPILARIYHPEDYGSFALFLLGGQTLGLILAGRYEQVIMLTRHVEGVWPMVRTCIALAATAGAALFIVFFFASHLLDGFLGVKLAWAWPLVAIYAFFTSISATLTMASIRYAQFGSVSMSRLVKSIAGFAGQVFFGISILGGYEGLVCGELLSIVLSAAVLINVIKRSQIKSFDSNMMRTKRYVRAHLQRYADYPTINLLHVLIHSFTAWLMMLMISKYFSVSDAGNYFMMYRIVMLPVGVFGAALAQTYYRDGAESYRLNSRFDDQFKRVAIVSASMGVLVVLALLIAGKWLFIHVLGPQWSLAGELAVIFSPYVAFHFTLATLAPSVQISGHLRQALLLNILQNSVLLASFWGAGTYFGKIQPAVAMVSYCSIPIMLLIIGLYWKWSKNKTHKSVANEN